MRVISGSAKARKLKSPPATTRPIMDRVKESLFNILGTDVIGANVLDLFAGAGSVGIEALSRGARQATFIELNHEAVRMLRENLKITGLAGKARIVRENVFKFLKGEPPALYDIVYVAPPQYRELWSETMALLDKREFITPAGVIVVQIHPKEYEELNLDKYELVDKRKYGSTLLCFYERKENLEGNG